MEKTAGFQPWFSPIKAYITVKEYVKFVSLPFFVRFRLNMAATGQTDLERKFSADEREPYECTASEETKIEQKTR